VPAAAAAAFSWSDSDSDSSSSSSDSDSDSDSSSSSDEDEDDACPFSFEAAPVPTQEEEVGDKIEARLEDDGKEVVAAMMGYDSDFCGHGRGNKFRGVRKTGDVKRAAAQLLQNQSVKVRKDSGKKTDRRHRHHLLEMKRDRLGTDAWTPCGFPDPDAAPSALEAAKAAKEEVIRLREKRAEAAKKPLAQKKRTSAPRRSADTRPVQEGFSWASVAKQTTD